MLENNITFTDGKNEYKIIQYIEELKMYRLKNYTLNKETELMKEELINKYLNNKEYYLNKLNKNKAFDEKVKKEIEKEIEQKNMEEQEYNFCYGFCDSKTNLQKGKILKILNKKIKYNNEIYSRKKLIEKLIKNEKVKTEEYFNNNRISQKRINLEYKKLKSKKEYRIYHNNKFLLVTKTEFDYCNYLLNLIKK